MLVYTSPMTTLTCDLCDHAVTAETFDAWLDALKPHYAQVHTDFMAEQGAKTPEEQMAAMQQWVEVNKERFENA